MPTESPTLPTAPDTISLSVCGGFASAGEAEAFGHTVALYARELSRHINISSLDGITVTTEYEDALAKFDRGIKSTWIPKPTNEEYAVGAAMTLSALRGDVLKSHVFLHMGVAAGLQDPQHPDFPLSLHTLAHELAHVEINAAFDRAFPGVMLRRQCNTVIENFHWQVIGAAWDEYAATLISAGIGHDHTDGYENTFLRVLSLTRDNANAKIREYRRHGDTDRVLGEVYGAYGNLLKYAAYHLGNLAGLGIALGEREATAQGLRDSWFAPHFERLRDTCEVLASSFGRWEDQENFLRIGRILDDMVREGGVFVTLGEGPGCYVDIPFTAHTV